MRIAFLDQYSDLGGAQWCLADAMRGAAERGWQGELWAPDNGPLCAAARQLGFGVHRLPLRRYANGSKTARDFARYAADGLRGRWALANACRERRIDLFYANGPRVLPCIAHIGTPLLFHSHSVLDKGYSRWIAKWSLRSRPSLVLASSEFLAAGLRPLTGEQPVRVVYNGVPDYGYRPPHDNSGAVRVGIVGRIAPEKGHFDFLEAARILATRASVAFVTIGAGIFSSSGYEDRVRQQGKALGVEFAGWREPCDIYRDLDILAVPSAAYDANPRVVMEAMAAGVPVIAYRSGGIAEMVTDGENGLLTERKPDALAAAIDALARDPNLRNRLAIQGRRTYERRFTLGRFQREVCEAILHAAGGTSHEPTAPRCGSPARLRADDVPPASR